MASLTGHYWAFEKADKEDADWLLVFVEPDQTVWYGKVKFSIDDFVYMEKYYPQKPKWTPKNEQ